MARQDDARRAELERAFRRSNRERLLEELRVQVDPVHARLRRGEHPRQPLADLAIGEGPGRPARLRPRASREEPLARGRGARPAHQGGRVLRGVAIEAQLERVGSEGRHPFESRGRELHRGRQRGDQTRSQLVLASRARHDSFRKRRSMAATSSA